MDANQLIPSKYLKKEDFPQPALLTISGVVQEMISGDAGSERKGVMYFSETDKGLVLNRSIVESLKVYLGQETEHWPGKRVVIFIDATITFRGKTVGGLRLRAPKVAAATQGAAPPSRPPPPSSTDDGLDSFDNFEPV